MSSPKQLKHRLMPWLAVAMMGFTSSLWANELKDVHFSTQPQLRIIQQQGGKESSPTFSLTMKQVVPKAGDKK